MYYCSGAGRLAREAAPERPEPQLQQAGAARGRGERGAGDQVDGHLNHDHVINTRKTATMAFLYLVEYKFLRQKGTYSFPFFSWMLFLKNLCLTIA